MVVTNFRAILGNPCAIEQVVRRFDYRAKGLAGQPVNLPCIALFAIFFN